MKKELLNLGETPKPDQKRDAVHIAVIPIVAGETLRPGQHVGMKDEKAVPMRNLDPDAPLLWLGVVDPFLMRDVGEGESFWLFLNPGTITGLRHEWTHPAFSLAVVTSREWLQEYADLYRIDYESLIKGVVSGDGGCFGTDGGPQWTRTPEFWAHVENVTGRKFSEDHRETTRFFCACC